MLTEIQNIPWSPNNHNNVAWRIVTTNVVSFYLFWFVRSMIAWSWYWYQQMCKRQFKQLYKRESFRARKVFDSNANIIVHCTLIAENPQQLTLPIQFMFTVRVNKNKKLLSSLTVVGFVSFYKFVSGLCR